MGELIVKVWYLIAVLPFVIFMEGSKKFANFLKKKNIYSYWDVWHSYLVILIVVAIVLWMKGYR